MTPPHVSSLRSDQPYIPHSLGEIYDLLGSMILGAPTFHDTTGIFPEQDIESEFLALIGGFGATSSKIGEETLAELLNLADRAKNLFSDDPTDSNGKTDQGRALLFEIEGIIQGIRRKRAEARSTDSDEEITDD